MRGAVRGREMVGVRVGGVEGASDLGVFDHVMMDNEKEEKRIELFE